MKKKRNATRMKNRPYLAFPPSPKPKTICGLVKKCKNILPRHSARLHPVGEGDVVGPDVELPLPEADHPAEDVARVHADPHVHVRPRRLANGPKKKTLGERERENNFVLFEETPRLIEGSPIWKSLA